MDTNQECNLAEEQRKIIDKRFDKVLKRTGGFGNHQMFVVTVLALINQGVHLVLVNMSYLQKVPREYFCTYRGSPDPVSCVPRDFCSDPTVTGFKPNMALSDSFNNWVDQFDLVCASKAKVGFIGASYFIGWILTMLFVPRIADVIGRQKLLIGGTLL